MHLCTATAEDVVSVQECKVFEEVVSVRCPASKLRISIKGAGIAPAVKVTSHCLACCLACAHSLHNLWVAVVTSCLLQKCMPAHQTVPHTKLQRLMVHNTYEEHVGGLCVMCQPAAVGIYHGQAN